MESTEQETAELPDLQKTIANATEILAAFISLGRSDELPIVSLMEAAEKTLPDLHEWRKTIEAIGDIVERDAVH